MAWNSPAVSQSTVTPCRRSSGAQLQVEPAPCARGQPRLQLRVAPGAGVYLFERGLHALAEPLHRPAVHGREGRAQAGVTIDQRLQRRAQRRRVHRRPDADGASDVVRRALRRELLQKPQGLLAVGERDGGRTRVDARSPRCLLRHRAQGFLLAHGTMTALAVGRSHATLPHEEPAPRGGPTCSGVIGRPPPRYATPPPPPAQRQEYPSPDTPPAPGRVGTPDLRRRGHPGAAGVRGVRARPPGTGLHQGRGVGARRSAPLRGTRSAPRRPSTPRPCPGRTLSVQRPVQEG